MENSSNSPNRAGSVTPGLEGAPCSHSHENRSKSVISAPQSLDKPREEGSPSKP